MKVFLLTYEQLDDDATEHEYVASGWVTRTLEGAKKIALELMGEWHAEYRDGPNDELSPEWEEVEFRFKPRWVTNYKGLYGLCVEEVELQE